MIIQGLLLASVGSGTAAMLSDSSVAGVRLFTMAFMLGASALVLAIAGRREVK